MNVQQLPEVVVTTLGDLVLTLSPAEAKTLRLIAWHTTTIPEVIKSPRYSQCSFHGERAAGEVRKFLQDLNLKANWQGAPR